MRPLNRNAVVALLGALGLVGVALFVSNRGNHVERAEAIVDASMQSSSRAPLLPAADGHSEPRMHGSGIVVDATGKPVSGATVKNVTANLEVVSDTAGHFAIPLADGTNTLVARKARLVGDAFISAGDAPVTVTMSNGHDVAIDVIDCESKHAIANAQIETMDQRPTTDSTGAALIRSLPSSSQLLTLQAEGYEPLRTGLFRNHEGDEPGHVKLELCRGERVRGRVIDESGQPISGAVVTVTSLALRTHSTVTTNEAGSWELAAVAPGIRVVEVVARGFVSEKQSIVPAGSSIVLKRIGDRSGVVRTEAGAAVANAKIFGERGPSGVSDANGRFETAGGPNSILWVEAENLGSEVLSPFTNDRTPIVVTMFPTALSIKVIDVAGQPSRGATVFATGKQGRKFEVVTDRAGNAEIRGLPVSQYRVLAESDGKDAYSVVTLTREKASTDVTLTIK